MWFSLALAAPSTAMPSALGGMLELRYAGQFQTGRLIEANQTIAKRQVQEHHLGVSLAFAPIAGAAITLAMDNTLTWRWSYAEAHDMVLEPVDGGGTYLFGKPGETVARKGAGVQGMWIGAAFAPFSERFFPKQRGSWRFDLAVRPGNKKNNRWTVRDGKRGASPGSTAIRVGAAFSQRTGTAEPYVRMRLDHELKSTIELADEQGAIATEFVIDPASTVEIAAGTGLLTSGTDPSSFDLHLGARYRTWVDLPSGMLLPNVIQAARAVPATHSESIAGFFGMGVDFAFTANVGLSLGGRMVYTVPHRQHHLFDVTTSPDTIGAEWTAALRGNLSKSDFD